MSTILDVDFVINTVKKAIAPLSEAKKETLIIHSDQGTHYTSTEYKNLFKKHKIIQSMSRQGKAIVMIMLV